MVKAVDTALGTITFDDKAMPEIAGKIIDTIVYGLSVPLGNLPVAASAIGMMGAHTVIHLPVPSTSGQAVLTMPVLIPLSSRVFKSRSLRYNPASSLAFPG